MKKPFSLGGRLALAGMLGLLYASAGQAALFAQTSGGTIIYTEFEDSSSGPDRDGYGEKYRAKLRADIVNIQMTPNRPWEGDPDEGIVGRYGLLGEGTVVAETAYSRVAPPCSGNAESRSNGQGSGRVKGLILIFVDGRYELTFHLPKILGTTEGREWVSGCRNPEDNFSTPGNDSGEVISSGPIYAEGRLDPNNPTAIAGTATYHNDPRAWVTGYVDMTATVTWNLTGEIVEAAVTLSGCTDLALGQTMQVTASGQPAGGTYSFRAEPAAAVAVTTQDNVATLTGKSPGRATLSVEYTTPDGKRARASQEASCVELVSVNSGQPLPKLGLYDADGKRLSGIREVPLQIRPADSGTLLSFKLEDESIASLVTSSKKLELQAVKEGRTTAQAQTRCGQKLGPALEIEVMPCDDEVIAELNLQLKWLQRRINEIMEEAHGLVGELPSKSQFIWDCGKAWADASKAIITAVGAAGKAAGVAGSQAARTGVLEAAAKTGVPEGAKTAADLYTAGDMLRQQIVGDVQGVTKSASLEAAGKIAEQTTSTAAQALTTAASLVDDLLSATESWSKVAEHAAKVYGNSYRLKEVSDALDQRIKELDKVIKTLVLCKAAHAPPGLGSRATTYNPRPTQQYAVQLRLTASPPAASPVPLGPVVAGPVGAAFLPGVVDAASGAGTAGGQFELPSLPERCHPSKFKDFASVTLGSFQKEVERFQSLLQGISTAAELPDAQRHQTYRAALPKLEAFLSKARSFDDSTFAFARATEGCEEELAGATEKLTVALESLIKTTSDAAERAGSTATPKSE